MGKHVFIDSGLVDLSRLDGANDYLSRGSDLTGNADGKVGTASFWFRTSGATTQYICAANAAEAGGIKIANAPGGASTRFSVRGYNAASTLILFLPTVGAHNDGAYHHFMASWDLANALGDVYIDGSDDLGTPTLTDDTIDYTLTDFYIGSLTNASNKYNGDLGQLYINLSEYVDLSTAANRAKFYNGGPVNLGDDGSLPTGTAPIVFLNNQFQSFETNLGTGGGFTENGALADGGAV